MSIFRKYRVGNFWNCKSSCGNNLGRHFHSGRAGSTAGPKADDAGSRWRG